MTDFSSRRLLIEGVEKTLRDSDRSITIRIPRFVLKKGEIVAITGKNGSGKSTMLDMIAMLLKPDSASRFLMYTEDGQTADLYRMKGSRIDRLRRNHLAYILQRGGLLEFLTIKQNISLVQRLKGGKQIDPKEIVNALGIDKRLLHKKPGRLSGGERQKGAIARALVQHPEIILADEPTSAMDSKSGGCLMKIFTQRTKSFGTSLILVSHDPDLVKTHADRVYRFQLTDNEDKRLISTLHDETTSG